MSNFFHPNYIKVYISFGFYLSLLLLITFGFYFYHIILIILKFFKLKIAEKISFYCHLFPITYQTNLSASSTFVRISEYYRTTDEYFGKIDIDDVVGASIDTVTTPRAFFGVDDNDTVIPLVDSF